MTHIDVIDLQGEKLAEAEQRVARALERLESAIDPIERGRAQIEVTFAAGARDRAARRHAATKLGVLHAERLTSDSDPSVLAVEAKSVAEPVSVAQVIDHLPQEEGATELAKEERECDAFEAARKRSAEEARERIRAITLSAAAKGREKFASYLAFETELTVEQALGALAVAGVETRPVSRMDLVPRLGVTGACPPHEQQSSHNGRAALQPRIDDSWRRGK